MLAFGLVCTAAACSNVEQPAAGVAAVDARADNQAGDLAGARSQHPGAGAAQLALPGSTPEDNFASLPDRGDLVAYPADKVVRRSGPQTWYRADVSEAHAIRAIVDGVLTLTAPSGELLRFAYDRHVEHESGDWTWFGHVVGGSGAEDAIITFGANAVFGSIARPGEGALALTMQDGASWLVETDRAALAAQSRAAGRYARPDFHVPEFLPEQPARGPGMTSLARAPTMLQASVATDTVDVLIGYTPGFVQGNSGGPGGSTSFVTTKLNFLVEVANESYANSQLSTRIRLVHSMQVDYPDATGNSEALYALTGSEGTTPNLANVDPALQPLHSARDQFGADLVTLIRDFNHPENVSCGVAWLIGGGRNATHAGYGVFGFSVVSDGTDGGFFCEDTTYAHELGHNMGLAHDVETAMGDDGVLDDPDDYGRFNYSFGYRTGPSQGNFYTVMAYSDEQVIGYKIFSNPRTTFCGGFQCGVLNEADNALTLETTAPIVATFRATVVPEDPQPLGDVHSDFNGDGVSDLLWRKMDTGQNTSWLSANASTPLTIGNVPNLAWHVVGTGDFDGDGSSDIVWRNTSNGQNIVWRSGNRNTTLAVASVSATWQMVGVGDFDGDGVADLLWRNASDGRNVIWFSANAQASQSIGVVGGQWIVAGVGDFDGDARDDIFWRNEITGQNIIWHSANKQSTTAAASVIGADWQVVAVADFNGDGEDDAFWRHAENGGNALWLGGDAGNQQQVASIGNPAWTVVAAGDYNGDGEADLAWRNTSTGANTLWLSADAGTAQPIARITDQNWQVVP